MGVRGGDRESATTGGDKVLKLQKTWTAAKPNPGAWDGCWLTAKPMRDHERRPAI